MAYKESSRMDQRSPHGIVAGVQRDGVTERPAVPSGVVLPDPDAVRGVVALRQAGVLQTLGVVAIVFAIPVIMLLGSERYFEVGLALLAYIVVAAGMALLWGIVAALCLLPYKLHRWLTRRG